MNFIHGRGSRKARGEDEATRLEAENVELRQKLDEQERERAVLGRERSRLEEALSRAEDSSALVHEAYLKRIAQQTDSTMALSATIKATLEAAGEISRSYREMEETVRSVAAVSRALSESFGLQAAAQDAIVAQVESVNAAALSALDQTRSLKSHLEQIEDVRLFMSRGVDTIGKISARLSLLSMNGRIEAAHAGEYGLGFSVVAQEMIGLQEESQGIIKAQREQLRGFLPLLGEMQERSDAVEIQAGLQRDAIEGIAGGAQVIRDQAKDSLGRVEGLAKATSLLESAIERGLEFVGRVDREGGKVEKIVNEEVFVSKKMNDLDAFIYGISKKAGSLAEAASAVVNEYQRISVLNGSSYVWQGESWLVTDRNRLPPSLRGPGDGRSGGRVLVCIGQTEDNPLRPRPLEAGSGIIEMKELEALEDPRDRLQGLRNFLAGAGIKPELLREPSRVSDPLKHATMSCMERFEGDYKDAMADAISRGRLVCTFSFGGMFGNGDVLVNHFLSTYQRTQADADKFSLLGESLVLALQGHVESGRYWRS